MVQPAISGTYPHPGIPDATVTAGAEHLVPWLQQHLSRPRPLVVDIETRGVDLDGYRIKCTVLATEGAAFVADPRDYYQATTLPRVFSHATTLIGHKLNFDMPSLVINRLMNPQDVQKAVDTLIWARLAEPGEFTPKTLDACCERYLGARSTHKITDMFKVLGLTKREGFIRLDIDSPAYLYGAAADGIMTARLEPQIRRAARARFTGNHPFGRQGLNAEQAEIEMERQQIENRWGIRQTIRGLKVNYDYLDQYRGQHAQQRVADVAELNRAGIDPGNGNHLTKHLLDIGQLPPDHPRTATGKPKADQKALGELPAPIARTFARVKKLDKITTYLDKCRELSAMDGRIHPTTECLAAAHGRSSMRGVEIHQFPGLARPIVAFDEEGTSVDWSAQEPMLAINAAGDVDALYGYEYLGQKIYDGFSENLAYKTKKVVILAGMYGEGLRKLSVDLGLDIGPWVQKRDRQGNLKFDVFGDPVLIPTYAAAKALQADAFSSIPKTWESLKALKNIAKQYGCIITMNGRIVPIPMGKGFVDEETGEIGPPSRQTHKGPNYRICGSAADMKTDVIVEAERRGIGDGIWFNMHDEFVVASSIAHEVQQIMQTPSERFIAMAGRVPVIRTDLEPLGMHWRGEEK